jgi:hypothetical protein
MVLSLYFQFEILQRAAPVNFGFPVCRTLLQFSKKKRKRTTSEGSDLDLEKTPPPSPPDEDSGSWKHLKSGIEFNNLLLVFLLAPVTQHK